MSAHDTCLWYPAATHTFRSCVGAIHYHQSSGICPDCGRPYEIDGAKDQAEGLRELVKDLNDMRDFMVRPPIDKAALWDTLKSELEAESDHFYADFLVGGTAPVGYHGDALKAAAARATIDRMLQMETLANTRRVVVPSTMEPT